MDLYLTSAEPGLTLQEMIEYDIKSGAFKDCIPEEAPSKITKMEFDPSPFDMDSVNIASMVALDDEFEFQPFEPIFESLLPDFEIESIESQSSGSESPAPSETINSWINYSTISNSSLDVMEHGTIMVNPSAVLPSTMHGGTGVHTGRTSYLSVSAPSSSPVIDTTTQKSRVNYSTSNNPNTVNSSSSSTNAIFATVKKEHETTEPSNKLVQTISATVTQSLKQQQAVNTQVILAPIKNSTSALANTAQVLTNTHCLKTNNLSTNTGTVTLPNNRVASTALLTLPSSTGTILSTANSTPNIINGISKTLHSSIASTTSVTSAINRIGTSPIYRTTSTGIHQINRTKTIPKYKKDLTPEEKAYPKPAYSYSCLIALALKNSLTGSLPVSEIYSFMCEHFPYFRTAPNGWKNSVRHNLSLNKCFEKIEKPVVSGSNQRKGCLWALNPAKAHKMDEEVHKWSKKDLQGIKEAMPNPEILENLERGEMKFEVTSSGASSCSEDEEEEEIDLMSTDSHAASATDLQPMKILKPLNTPIVLPANGTARIIQPNGTGVLRTLNQIKLAARLNSSDNQGTLHVRRNSSCSTQSPTIHEPEYILPDSTMPEINIQSNGSILDDFGNEIKIEGELGILNPSSSSNLILRKVNSPLRQSPVRSNFIYASTSPHQAGINRLILTNTKMS